MATRGGWLELTSRLDRLGDDGAFVLLPMDALADIRSVGLVGLQLVGHTHADGAEVRCLFVPLRDRAKNPDGSRMDAADLLDFAIGLAGNRAVIYGDRTGIFAHHHGQSYQLADHLDVAALGRAYGQAQRVEFGFCQDGGFVFDAVIAPKSYASALAMLGARVWD